MFHLRHLRRDSERFVEVMREADPLADVPSCPDWTSDDLLWHLGRVQAFWARVVADRLLTDDDVEGLYEDLVRPSGRDGLLAFFQSSNAELLAALTAADPGQEAWTWHANHSVAWIARRMAHEALIHRVDAELTTGAVSDVDPDLAADGVDEALRVMLDNALDDLEVVVGHVELVATDQWRTWRVAVGRTADDEAELSVIGETSGAAGSPGVTPQPTIPTARISGSAADLDLWLWGRVTAERLRYEGSSEVIATLAEVVDDGII